MNQTKDDVKDSNSHPFSRALGASIHALPPSGEGIGLQLLLTKCSDSRSLFIYTRSKRHRVLPLSPFNAET